MGSKGRMPTHQRRPLLGSNMLHPDAMIPSSMHDAPPGAFSSDIRPPPELIEQKLDMQQEDMQKLVIENQRLATTHFTLRQELTLAQQELQRMDSHISAMKVDQDQQTRALLDKMAKMKDELHASESVKVEYQKACAEARGLAADRQELIVKVQQLTQDLQKSQASGEDISTLMSQRKALQQEYQSYRAEYDYERKLLNDHYESLQAMEKNYLSMVREIEKLRAQLTNATNLERSGASYGTSAVYKENDISGHQSVGQNAYDDGFGVSQNHGPPSANAAPYSGGPPIVPALARAGYEEPRNPAYEYYDAPRNVGYSPSQAAGYDPSKSGNYEAPRNGGKDDSSSYDTASRGNGVSQAVAMAPGGNSGLFYGSGLASNPYGSVQMPPPNFGSAQAANIIAPPNYGAGQPTNPYGAAQTTAPSYGTGQPPKPYGSVQGTPQPQYGSLHIPTNNGAVYDAPRGNVLRQ